MEWINKMLDTIVAPMPVTGTTSVDIFLRIACALLAGLVVGIEREVSRHPAGLRTNMLVALGACIVMITAESICTRYYGITNCDPSRMGAQVISGVGFLGAGTIIHKGVTVQGLTTAASLWAVACLGLAAGNGDYLVVLVCAILIGLLLSVVDRLAQRGLRRKQMFVTICFGTDCLEKAMEQLSIQADKYRFSVVNVSFEENAKDVQVEIRVKFDGEKQQKHIYSALAALFGELDVHTLSYASVEEQ